MFKIVKQRRVEWPVVIPVPQSGGKVQKHEITAEFDILPQTRIEEITAEARSGDQDKALLREVLVGWDDVAGEDGQPIGFSPEARDALIDISYVRAALMRAYFEASSGAAARKN